MFKSSLLTVETGFFLLASAAGVQVSALLPRETSECCKTLQNAGLEHVYLPGDPSYAQQIESYWSLTAQLTPYCIVEPENAQDVSTAVATLVQQTRCNFAVRSGGHSSNAGANNIEEGVTIDLNRMNTTTYKEAEGVASILPAAHWLGVYRHLDPLGVGVPGGRLGTVGVGGLVLGGGFSYYIYQRGLVCDNVRNFEIVLASGAIVNANATENADLWTALKGGRGNFGVVTRIDLEAFPRTPIWGGAQARPATPETNERTIDAIVDWTNNIENYQNGSMLVLWTYTPADNATLITTALADVGGQVAAPAYDKFLSIPGKISSSLGMTNMSTLALRTQSDGYRNVWFTLTFKNDARVVRKAVDLHDVLVEEMKKMSPDDDFETQCFFQPFPTVIAKHSVERGGNIVGIDSIEENAIVWLGSLAVNGVDQEEFARMKMKAWNDAIEEYSRSIGAYVGYRYSNYADQSQDVIRTYREENIQKMLTVAEKYDPEGVFQYRVPGGFKLPSAL